MKMVRIKASVGISKIKINYIFTNNDTICHCFLAMAPGFSPSTAAGKAKKYLEP